MFVAFGPTFFRKKETINRSGELTVRLYACKLILIMVKKL